MLPDRVSNPGPLTYESGALPTAQRGPALWDEDLQQQDTGKYNNLRIQPQEFVFKSEIRLKSPKSPNSRSSSRRRLGDLE